MRSIPTALNTELGKEANFLAHLIELYFSSTLYYTDLDIDLWLDGNQYLSRGLVIGEAHYTIAPQIDKMKIEFDNTALEFSSLVLNQETRGKKAVIRLAAIESPGTVIASSVLFSGVIDSCDIDHKKAAFNIFNPWIFWRRKTPRRIHQASCHWAFKSDECGYSGAELWCDQSYDRCQALSNTPHFGGFRWLPKLVNKQIWWGRSPKV